MPLMHESASTAPLHRSARASASALFSRARLSDSAQRTQATWWSKAAAAAGSDGLQDSAHLQNALVQAPRLRPSASVSSNASPRLSRNLESRWRA